MNDQERLELLARGPAEEARHKARIKLLGEMKLEDVVTEAAVHAGGCTVWPCQTCVFAHWLLAVLLDQDHGELEKP